MLTTIQRTRKAYKAGSVIAIALIFGSFLEINSDPQIAAAMFFFGCVGYVIVRILIWWNHA